MSRQIEAGARLNEDDKRYIAERPWLVTPKIAKQIGEVELDQSTGLEIDQVANTGAANTAGLSPEEFEARQEAQAKAEGRTVEGKALGKEEDEDYGDMTVAELQAIAIDRGLSVEGRKADLVARLEANDAGADEDDEEE